MDFFNSESDILHFCMKSHEGIDAGLTAAFWPVMWPRQVLDEDPEPNSRRKAGALMREWKWKKAMKDEITYVML